MTSLNDFPINESALSSKVFENDTAIKTYLSNIRNKDKVSPWSVWTESYFCPYVGRMQTPESGDGTEVFSSISLVKNLPFWKGKVLESSGRIFLGGEIYVKRSAFLKESEENLDKFKLQSQSTDKMLVHMQKSDTEDDVETELADKITSSVDGNLASHFRKKARSLEKQQKVSFLSDPRVYSNKSSLKEFSLNIPVDANYIAQNEYWSLHIEPFSGETNNFFVAGAQTVVGWEGVAINLRFASLLEE